MNGFIDAFATENNLDFGTAERLTTWLTTEGVLDFAVIHETYPNETAANDA